MFDVLQPYGETSQFLTALCLVGVALYFVTSSDSGSYVDDIISANGLPNPPLFQKFFWAFTEGAVATGLLTAGGNNSLRALQAVSICAGLPYTFALCFLCTSIHRGLKIDQHERDVCAAAQWSTGVLDAWDFYAPGSANDYFASPRRWGAPERLASVVRAFFAPFLGVRAIAGAIFDEDEEDDVSPHAGGEGGASYDDAPTETTHSLRSPRSLLSRIRKPSQADLHGGVSFVFFACCICFLSASAKHGEWRGVGWAFFFCHICQVAFLRNETRKRFGIYGNAWEDFFVSLVLYPGVVSQMELQAWDAADLREEPAETYVSKNASF